jgi:hypothetical protein
LFLGFRQGGPDVRFLTGGLSAHSLIPFQRYLNNKGDTLSKTRTSFFTLKLKKFDADLKHTSLRLVDYPRHI